MDTLPQYQIGKMMLQLVSADATLYLTFPVVLFHAFSCFEQPFLYWVLLPKDI